MFPKLRQKYGSAVTYDEDPKAHIRVEFGFDMTQVAKNRYTSDRYHDFIGFEVSKSLLERAFQDTYSIPLSAVIADEDLAIGTFRRSISHIIPEMTRVALVARKQEIVSETPNFNSREFRYYLSRADYQREWGKGYRRPGTGARILAFLLRFMPKVGPLKALSFKIPTRATEDLYIAGVDHTLENYRGLLSEVRGEKLRLPNTDFDTGKLTRAGEYSLADDAYAQLLDQLAHDNFAHVSPQLRQNILDFYGDEKAPNATGKTAENKTAEKKNAENWQKTQDELQRLNTTPSNIPSPRIPDSTHSSH